MVSSWALFASWTALVGMVKSVAFIASGSAVVVVRSSMVLGFLIFFTSLGRSLDSMSSSEAARYNTDLEAMILHYSEMREGEDGG
jgi:hypothetical protein